MTTKGVPSELSLLVKQRREELGLRQDDLAELTGMSQEWVSSLERGVTQNPRVPTLHKLARALRLDVTELFIAANVAKAKADADRIVEELPPAADPILDVLMSGARRLTPAGRKLLIEHLKDIEQFEIELAQQAEESDEHERP